MIFMDVQMPLLDGYQTTQAIRQGSCGSLHTNTPIIAMTANAMAGDQEKCIAAGMNEYISKPISLDAIRQKIALIVN